MSWTEGYLQAKLGDVPFFIRRASTKGGRRNVKHIFPRSDNIDHEDMGARDREFKLAAYILGDDYYTQRQALEDVLNSGGEMILVHPYRGVLTVVVDKWKCNETTDEGRMARYTLAFSLQGDEPLTVATPNTQNKILSAKHSYIENILAWLNDVYNLASRPATAIEDARDTIDDALRVIDAAKRTAGTVAEFKRQLQSAKGDAIALSLNVQYLGQTFSGLIDFGTEPGNGIDFGSTSEDAVDQTREQRQIASTTETPVVNTPEAIAQDDDYPAYQIQKLVRFSALAASIGLITQIPFETVSDAEAAQTDLFAAIDNELADPAITDDMYATLRDVKQVVFDDLQSRVIDLPLVIDYVSNQPTNSLALTQELYGNSDNEQDIIERNSLVHPGFISAAVTLQVKVQDE